MPSDPAPPDRKAVLIVDDHPMLRRGLAALIGSEPGLEVCGEAATVADAFAAIGTRPPDLVIVDLALSGADGLDLVKEMQVRCPEIPVLVLSMHDEAVYAERVLRAGARGYVSKRQLDDTVLVAIQRVLAGELYLSDALQARLASKYLGGRTLATDSPLQVLSDRELQVFRLVGQGRSTRQIAAELHLSVKTIESHYEHVKQKLGFESGAEMVRSAAHWVDTGQTR